MEVQVDGLIAFKLSIIIGTCQSINLSTSFNLKAIARLVSFMPHWRDTWPLTLLFAEFVIPPFHSIIPIDCSTPVIVEYCIVVVLCLCQYKTFLYCWWHCSKLTMLAHNYFRAIKKQLCTGEGESKLHLTGETLHPPLTNTEFSHR